MTTPREHFESAHTAALAPWAVTEADSGSRAHTEPPHRYRTCFQRDRDRIVHCSAFRRLDFKTQVFVPHECDHHRTRLTHTLEVSQIARTLARAMRLNEDVCEAVALAHDLGHPPFGHAGEAVLDELMAAAGGFEHNRQSLRIVDYLEHPYPQFRGLNLTRVVRECLARHETLYDQPAGDEFGPGRAGPMEGQVVDLADEIAYTSADTEDALAAGLIDRDRLGKLALWQRAWDDSQAAAPDARDIHKQIRSCKAVLTEMADDAIATTAATIGRLGIASVDDVRRANEKCVTFSRQMRIDVTALQQFLMENVYTCGENLARQREGCHLLRELFEAYAADASRLPQRYRDRVQADGLLRVVCDYVAGMTDRYCRQEHRKLQ